MKIKRILLTGGKGFLGSILRNYLEADGYEVITLGRDPSNTIVCNLANQIPELRPVDLVVHNAGKAHTIPRTIKEAEDFFSVNQNGTVNLLHGISKLPGPPQAIVFVSSVSVYGREEGTAINEDEPMRASDPYGRSKIEAEKLILEWCLKRETNAGIVRLPLVAARNAPGNLGAMIKAMRNGYYFQIAKGSARKSMVLAEDVAKIIPRLAEIGGVYNLTDGHHPSFNELERTILTQLNKHQLINLPRWVAAMLGRVGDLVESIAPNRSPVNTNKLKKITSTLTFDDSRARSALGWNPKRVIDADLI
jgi:nucleoside-diphosphate-sugar epimerase